MRVLSIATVLGLLSSTFGWTAPPEYAIKPSQDGRHFVTAKGDPFFWQADTAWLLFHRLTLQEADTYLSDRAAKGYTVVLAVGVSMFGDRDVNRNGDLPLVDFDLRRPNEVYWAHVDKVVELAWKKGIRICLVPSWGQYLHSDQNVPGTMTVAVARDFGRWIGKRYPNLPKTLNGDTNPYWRNKTGIKLNYAAGGAHSLDQWPAIDYSDVYNEMAEGIVEGEGTSAMISIHLQNQWFPPAPIALASLYFGDKKWFTYDTSQSGHASFPPNAPIPWWNCKRGYETVELMYQLTPTRPNLDNEPHYEHRFDNAKSDKPYWNASDVRAGSWQSVFAGAAGLTYGNDNVMQMYSELFNHSGSGLKMPWSEAIKVPGAGQMQYIKKAILDRAASPLNRIPDQSVLSGDLGKDDKQLKATRDKNGGYILVYTPTGAPFTVDVSSLNTKTGKKIRASWYNPLDGKYSAFQWTGVGKTVATPPKAADHTDWLLVLEAK